MATLNTSDISPQMIDGLAVYDLGHGIGQDETVLLMPQPVEKRAEQSAVSSLALLLIRLGRRVITFDPPGSNGSGGMTRHPNASLIPGALASLNQMGVEIPVDVLAAGDAVPHALALTHRFPNRVNRLMLVDTIPAMPDVDASMLAEIKTPVLLFLGACDHACRDRAIFLDGHLPNSQLIIHPADGLHPHQDAPIHFGATLRHFLDHTPPRPGRVISVEM